MPQGQLEHPATDSFYRMANNDTEDVRCLISQLINVKKGFSICKWLRREDKRIYCHIFICD